MTFTTSEEFTNIACALSVVQAKLRPTFRGQRNTYFKSRYADLAAISESCRELLADQELAVVQAPGACDVTHFPELESEAEQRREQRKEQGKDKEKGRRDTSRALLHLTTFLVHSSGEWFRSELSMPLVSPDPQAYGSAVTYARRYALAAMIGVVTNDDDDGNRSAQRPVPVDQAEPVISDSDCALLQTLIESGPKTVGEITSAYHISTLRQLPASKFARLSQRLTELVAPGTGEVISKAQLVQLKAKIAESPYDDGYVCANFGIKELSDMPSAKYDMATKKLDVASGKGKQ